MAFLTRPYWPFRAGSSCPFPLHSYLRLQKGETACPPSHRNPTPRSERLRPQTLQLWVQEMWLGPQSHSFLVCEMGIRCLTAGLLRVGDQHGAVALEPMWPPQCLGVSVADTPGRLWICRSLFHSQALWTLPHPCLTEIRPDTQSRKGAELSHQAFLLQTAAWLCPRALAPVPPQGGRAANTSVLSVGCVRPVFAELCCD